MSIRVVASVLIAAAGVGLGAQTDPPPPAAEPDLKGLGPVRPLAGRSPSYTVRQLFDFQAGNRKGAWAALMQAAVERLTVDDNGRERRLYGVARTLSARVRAIECPNGAIAQSPINHQSPIINHQWSPLPPYARTTSVLVVV